MGDKMREIPFRKLIRWIFEEYAREGSIFGIPKEKFFQKESSKKIDLFGDNLDTPIGPAAGPNTQLAQNIAASYLCGGRFIELKTVQILDALEFPKPCIHAGDECYNTEWSTELTIEGAFNEYVKAWFLLYIIQREIFDIDKRTFMFNMSVGYDLEGIKSEKVNGFIEGLKDASNTEIFKECKQILKEELKYFKNADEKYIDSISPNICSSITLSTLHGCPPAEIEKICRYLISEKQLHTFVKMNPTLLGYEYVKNTLHKMGYHYIELKEESFTHDLQYDDGVAMLKRLKEYAAENNREFGVKLSNTLPVKITRGELPGEEMYMSGKSLFALTINLAYRLASEFQGDLKISYSGGADYFNIVRIFDTGIQPITVATTILKPGGYYRLKQMADELEGHLTRSFKAIDVTKLKKLAGDALEDANYAKERKIGESRKIDRKLPLTDCFVAPCTVGCPIEQDVPEYTRLVGEGRHDEAFELIISKNPLPFITGTICNHNCMTKCTRLDYDRAVHIRDLKKEAAEKGCRAYMERLAGRAVDSKYKVHARAAIIGAGPSGLAAAYFLAKAGMDVTVFDKRDKPGGTVEHVIPEFRIAREDINHDIELIKKMGVKFRLGVDENFSIEDLKAQGYEYIYLAIGAARSNLADIQGDNEKVMSAIGFLEDFNKKKQGLNIGKNIAVIGGGNTAMDAARAATRVKGVEKVYIVYRRTREHMPADREELLAALEDGVIFKELLAPIALKDGRLKCEVMELGEPDASGRRKPVAAGRTTELEIDTVLSATGERVDLDILKKQGLEIDEKGNIKVNPATNETNIDKVFIGGDALTGPSTVVEAMAQGKKVARQIIIREQLEEGKDMVADIVFEHEKRYPEIIERRGILKGRPEERQGEADRCLECSYICNVCAEVCPNRANVAVKLDDGRLKSLNQVVHIDGMCNECGNCAIFCPYEYEGAPYKEKFTLYWNEGDFNDSENDGFYLVEEGKETTFRVRLDGRVSIVTFDEKGRAASDLDPSILTLIWEMFNKFKYMF
ncbi:putative selenate reductase subunit YgfK [Desulfitibacter alkalitolerans]|uniref:putative selenate reductase subunit YgfK n=1 Tax=Desulfitibacter alkalitolerans TaxID=264641 RepID=UPI0004884E55|nr:putative selenate reductase subunit YgfK [Desulfitibacter alkalitolerans]